MAYAKERVQFGKPIGFQQAISFKIADMATKLRCARFLVYSAAELKEEHAPYLSLIHISLCDDPFLSLAINLAFACSLRMGELLGLTWSCAASYTHLDVYQRQGT